jgi:hypothetical protein
MTYTVLWRPLAEQQLARLWTNAADRQEIASEGNLDRVALAFFLLLPSSFSFKSMKKTEPFM